MSNSNSYKPGVFTAIAIAGGLTLAWLWIMEFHAASLLVFAGFTYVGLICCCGLLAHWILRQKRQQQQFQRHIEAMCLCHMHPGSNDNVPALSADHPMSNFAEQIRNTILEYKRRAEDLEHARTAHEVHCLRAVTRAEQIKNIFEGLADPILAIDEYDELVLANHSAEEIFHFDTEKIETRALDKIVRCQKLIDLLSSVRHRKIAGARSEEIELTGENGMTQWYRATACKLVAGNEESPDKSQVSEGAVVVLRDIGDHKAVQKRNAEFVSSVSHEMKTPLAGIKAYVELLAEGEAEDENTREEFLNVISSQADRLQRLVENLLNIARIEAGVVNVNKQQQSLNRILEEALHVVQPSAEAKQINLDSQLSSMFLGVLADRDMLLQAAINLLSNAIKYTSRGGNVTMRSRLVGDRVRFEVQDTGVGLSPEDCQKVFEKFYRVKKDKDMAPGTGLGLSLAKHIIEDVHGGQLAVESTPGVGSTFSVSLRSAGQMKTEG
jgi:two-component system, OmpR family, phosphate regulon sensor histidine kinase PhoR